jgi:enoyl-CoA hydratase
MSEAAASPQAPDPEVLVSVEGAVGRLTLNRPKALGALTTTMVRLMTEALLAWRDDDAVTTVLIDHAGERGFCAGGDIRFLADSARAGGEGARHFFYTEYQLNHLLFTYPKTVIAVMDGITMGGGVGISLPARYRIATERTTFAMPETGIGLFPDVGGGWHLSRLQGATGAWLALTGARLKAPGCEVLGIATDVLPSAALPDFKARLIADPAAVDDLLAELDLDPGRWEMSEHHGAIDTLFGGPTVEAIFEALAADSSPWAVEQLAILKTKSPLSMKTALRQLQAGARFADFADNMAMEMRIGARIVMSHDFAEGVRAVIIDKDNKPAWSPDTLEGVTDAMLDAVFAPLPADQEWTPLVSTPQ